MRSSVATLLIVVGLTSTISACNRAPGQQLEVQYRPAPAHHARASSVSTLRPSDQLRVQVYEEPSISGEYQIDGSGSISVPLAGRVRAAGLSPEQLERAIASRLSRSGLKEPRVNVQVTTHAPFYIHGEVERSGEFPYRPGVTVMDAVAIAGGFTYRADERRAILRRAGSSVEKPVRLDAPIPIFPGDNIRIPERFF